MTTELASEKTRRSRRLRTIIIFNLTGLIIGGLGGFGFGRFIKHGLPPGLQLTWSEISALGLALALLLCGGMIATAGSNRTMAARMIDPAEPRDATPAQRAFYRLQAWVLMLAGVLLAIPVAVRLLPDGDSPAWRIGAMAALVLLFVLQSAWNLTIWRKADEFMRGLINSTAAACFWVLQSLLLIWAAGEKLGLLPVMSLWDALVVMMAVYLLVSVAQTVRKGGT